jgi:thiol-disulfide isomerase/thioredoxin
MKMAASLLLMVLVFTMRAHSQTMMRSATPNASPGAMMATPTAGRPMTGTELRLAAGSGGKFQFTDLAAAQELAAKGPTLLFFAADWCPTCKEALKDINANGAALKDVNVVVVDYDNSAGLKKMFGITYQHTFVQIDSRGRSLALWSGGGVAEILERVKKSP